MVDEVVDGGGWGGAGVELGGLDVYPPLPRIELRYRLGAMASQTLSNVGETKGFTANWRGLLGVALQCSKVEGLVSVCRTTLLGVAPPC